MARKQKNCIKNAPLEIRPKKLDKGIKSRSFEERLALAKACKEACDDAIASGRIKKTIDSYELC